MAQFLVECLTMRVTEWFRVVTPKLNLDAPGDCLILSGMCLKKPERLSEQDVVAMRIKHPLIGLLMSAAFVGAVDGVAQASTLDSLTVDLEAGPTGIIQNDGRYGAGGTAFDASTVAQNRNLFDARRFSTEAAWGDRHTLILLFAPFDVTTRVTLANPLTFRDTTFPAGAVVDHRYLFDGWRVSYLYRSYQHGPFSADFGATLGVRNALVSFTDLNSNRYDAERDIGPVPALKMRLKHQSASGIYALWDTDGFFTPGFTPVKGGILDSALSLGVPLQSGLDGFVRLRYLAGGADVPNRAIVNWSQFVGVSLGIRFTITPPKTDVSAAASAPRFGPLTVRE